MRVWILIVISIFFDIIRGIAQPICKHKLKRTEGTYILYPRVATDDYGNVYTLNNISIGPIEHSIRIQKIDVYGNVSWSKDIVLDSISSSGESIVVDRQENVYIVGYFFGSVDFDPSDSVYILHSAGEFDAFVQKLDPNGNLLWAKRMGGKQDDIAYSVTTDNKGGVYITGSFSNIAEFNTNPTQNYMLQSTGEYDVFIQKLDVYGNFVWAKNIGGFYNDEGHSITVDDTGNVYVTGYFWDAMYVDTEMKTYIYPEGFIDVFIQKLDNNGKLIWSRNIGGEVVDIGTSILVGKTGDVYITGHFGGVVDFDPEHHKQTLIQSYGDTDIFIQKLSSNGELIWVKTIGGPFTDVSNAMCLDKDDNMYITGYFGGVVDFDPGILKNTILSSGASDIFIQKINKYGESVWATSIGGRYNDEGASISVDNKKNVYVSGVFSDIVIDNMDTLIVSRYAKNFLYKISQVQSRYDTLFVDSLVSKDTVVLDTLKNILGCDSIILTQHIVLKNQVLDSFFITDSVSLDSTITQTKDTIDTMHYIAYTDTVSQRNSFQNETKEKKPVSEPPKYVKNVFSKNTFTPKKFVTNIKITENLWSTPIKTYIPPVSNKIHIDLGAIFETITVTVTNVFGVIIDVQSFRNCRYIYPVIDGDSDVCFLKISDNKKQYVTVEIDKR